MKKAFTLLEIMVVVLILGLLATLIVPNIIAEAEKTKRKIVCIQMQNIYNALNNFKLQYGHYPSTEEGLKALIQNPDPNSYSDYKPFLDTKTLPKDPWGTPYIYINDNEKIEIISLGADKKEGGEDENEDIKLSQCKK